MLALLAVLTTSVTGSGIDCISGYQATDQVRSWTWFWTTWPFVQHSSMCISCPVLPDTPLSLRGLIGSRGHVMSWLLAAQNLSPPGAAWCLEAHAATGCPGRWMCANNIRACYRNRKAAVYMTTGTPRPTLRSGTDSYDVHPPFRLATMCPASPSASPTQRFVTRRSISPHPDRHSWPPTCTRLNLTHVDFPPLPPPTRPPERM